MQLNRNIHIIGIQDLEPQLTNRQKIVVKNCVYFAGGKRHYKLVKALLPHHHKWTEITVPLTGFLDKLKKSTGTWVIFASGDPLFFGIANTLLRELPDNRLSVYPVFNSLQLLGHKLNLNYGEYKTVTLTGRCWTEFDKALLQGEPGIALLTDRKKTPSAIAQRMLDAGIDNYKAIIGECLGGKNERVYHFSLAETVVQEFNSPNCMFLLQTKTTPIPKGIDEKRFETLPGRPNMITKMPVRLTTLAYMQLQNKSTLWDIGACSGSVSIEAKLNNPHLQVIPFEIRPECGQIIQRNIKTFKVVGVKPFIGDFLCFDKSDMPKPDAVFLGGYGGKMDQILDHTNEFLPVSGVIAFNSVSEQSAEVFLKWAEKRSYLILIDTTVAVDSHNPIRILIANKTR